MSILVDKKAEVAYRSITGKSGLNVIQADDLNDVAKKVVCAVGKAA